MSTPRAMKRLRKALLRFRQWRVALKLAGKQAKLLPMLRALRTGGVPARQYAARIRTCQRCPIYDHGRKLCRKEFVMRVDDSPRYETQMVGCQCYVPYLAKTRAPYQSIEGSPDGPQSWFYRSVQLRRGCWGRVRFGAPFGWGAEP